MKNKIIGLVTVVNCCLLLLSCAPLTVNELKQTNDNIIRFEIDQGYQEVYRNVLAYARSKWDLGQILRLYNDLYTDIKKGEIIVIKPGPLWLWNEFVLSIDVQGLSDDKTTVTCHYCLIWKPVAIDFENDFSKNK